MLGTSISHYDIIGKLGDGGMGAVYQARDRTLPRLVALKFLNPRWLDSPEHLARFEHEARATSALNHPNIATIHGIEQSGGRRFLVLEYLPGGTLADRLAELKSVNARLSIEQALDYALAIAEGLRHAHEHGVIHRDIKASNLMFTEEGTLKITDFGLARLGEGPYVTETGNIVGTPPCMSPEQVEGKPVDHRSDIFSFGILLYQLIGGEMPFRGPGAAVLMYQIQHEDPLPLSRLRDDLPPGIEQIVFRTLQKDPDHRYQTMGDLIDDLHLLRHGRRSAIATRRSAQDTIELRAPRRWRSKFLVAGVALLLTGLTAVAAVLLTPSLREQVAQRLHRRQLPGVRRLAVLPFSTPDSADEALSDGLSDVLSFKLAQLEQFHETMRVVAASEINRTESRTPSAARNNFAANLAIVGEVRRSGDQIETMISLVETSTMVQLRSITIQTHLSEITVLRDRVIGKAAQMLDLELTEQVQKTLRAGETSVAPAAASYIEARGYLQRHDRTGNLPKAIALFQESIARDRTYALAWGGLSEAFLKQYDLTKDPRSLNEAYAKCARAIELNDQLEPLHVIMGLIATAKGDLPTAEAEFRRVLSLNPINSDAYRGLARTYEAQFHLKEAAEVYQRAISLRPGDWTGYNYLGGFYFHQGCYSEAEPNFRKVNQLTPDNSLAYGNLGAVYLEMGRNTEAIDMLQKSLALNAGVPMTLSNLGMAYYLKGQYAEAAKWMQKATELAPENEWMWGNLGHARHYDSQLAAQAPAAFRRAIELGEQEAAGNPRDADLQARLAMYWTGLGDRTKSLEAIRRALLLAPKSGFVQYRAAVVYEQAGNRERALRAIESALDLAYSREEIGKAPALQKLREDPRFPALLAKRAQIAPRLCNLQA